MYINSKVQFIEDEKHVDLAAVWARLHQRCVTKFHESGLVIFLPHEELSCFAPCFLVSSGGCFGFEALWLWNIWNMEKYEIINYPWPLFGF